MSIHAIGNKAVHQVLSLFVKLNESYPNPGHRIEHIQSIRAEDYPLLVSSKAFCAIQPVHLANDIPSIETHWQSIKSQAYPLKDIIRYAQGCGFGSDAPIETINPMHGIYTALERKESLNPEVETWMPEQKLDLQEAIYGYTYGAALIANREHELGLVKQDYLADLIVMEDFRGKPAEFWLDAEPDYVFCHGKPVGGALCP